MDGIGGHMKQEFCKFTVESLSASYIPFPRFLMEDCFAELTNDAKVLYALCWTEPVFPRLMAIPKRMARSVFISPWNRHRRSCTAADKAWRGYFSSWNSADWSAVESKVLADLRWSRSITLQTQSWYNRRKTANYRQDKGRKSDNLCPTSDANAVGHIFSLDKE